VASEQVVAAGRHLVDAADAALFEAEATGKNVVRAAPGWAVPVVREPALRTPFLREVL